MYYNKLLYYGKYTPKYVFIVPQTAEKSKRNIWKRIGEQLFESAETIKDHAGVSTLRPETGRAEFRVK